MQDGKRILQYGATEGYPPFVESLTAYVKKHLGLTLEGDGILPTTGSTSGMDLLCKALVDPGDTVLVESPTFLGNMQTLRLYQTHLVGVPSDGEGIIPEALEELAKEHHPRMLYVIPNFQNPTGRTLSAERRRRVVEIAGKYGFIIAEDDPYRDLRYTGEHLPTLKSFDTQGLVVYMGSFSKVISPGLRVGYLIAEKGLLRKCTIGKQGTDLHTPSLNQAIVDAFIRRDLLDQHIESILPLYAEKCRRMSEDMATLPGNPQYTVPEGGLFLFAEMAPEYNMTELFQKAVEKKVVYVPGTYFYPDGGHHNTLRLNFSNSTLEQIDDGLARIGSAMRK